LERFGIRKIIITHALFTGDQVGKELTDLGYKVINRDKLHVEMEGTLWEAIRLNLYLRSAHRVLFFLHQFEAKDLNDLYAEIKKISWEDFIPVNGYFSIHSFVRQKNIQDFRIVNLKMKDAIVDRFNVKYRKRPDSGNQNDHLVFFIHWVDDQCELYLDTSGETLSKHGYKKHTWKAPLLESLAASIIYVMQWDRNSTFINPMCGSGTLAIEAALIASNRYPGIYRDNYSFLHLKDPVAEMYRKEKEIILKAVNRDYQGSIFASDIHPGAIRQAKMNAEQAGVDKLINFESNDFQRINIPSSPGAIILNPGYGKRLGEEEMLGPVYEKIGDFFKQKCGGFTGYVFTGNPTLGKKIGLRTKRKIPFLNGNIECRLLEFELYAGSKKNKL
jgi:putative N6-adenine-specific DNA methylase